MLGNSLSDLLGSSLLDKVGASLGASLGDVVLNISDGARVGVELGINDVEYEGSNEGPEDESLLGMKLGD